ncbi:MAG: acetyl-CoA hydrolase/transferase C-terminal domain-containing protein [Dehalococcoidia bacterium]
MGDWRERYAEKLIDGDRAVALIEDGMTIHFGLASTCPLYLTPLVAERRDDLRDVIAYGDLIFYRGEWDEVHADQRRIELRCCYVTNLNRDVYRSGHTNYHPATVFTSQRRFERDIGPPDIGYFRLSEPDENGYCSVGNSVWDSLIAIRASKLVVAEIAEGLMPRSAGASSVHVDEIDYLVDLPTGWQPPQRPALADAVADPQRLAVLEVIGANTAELVHDRDTVEIGVGAGSNAVIAHLAGKHDLGFHSELTGPGIVQLHDEGVFTGKYKSRDAGKMVVTALPASPEDRALIAERHFDEWELYGVDYIHDPAVIASQSQMTAINTGTTIDLTGQVVFDSIGRNMHTGPGGQLEFVIGAVYAPGGRSIHALPSTAGDHSRIVAELPPGASVGIPRYLTDMVVTEYGVASMFGKSERARAEELIALAHPDHRADLRSEARRVGLL